MGIEINAQALELMKEAHSDLACAGRFINSSMEEALPPLKDNTYDLVYTMAVLEHLHSDSEFVFKEIARVTKKHLFVLEDEEGISKRHFPRNYKNIFESFGLKQVEEEVFHLLPPDKGTLRARLFVK